MDSGKSESIFYFITTLILTPIIDTKKRLKFEVVVGAIEIAERNNRHKKKRLKYLRRFFVEN